MFSGYSNFVSGVDTAFFFITAVSLFFLIGISATIIFFIIRYNKKRNPVASEIEGSNTLEIVWTVIPTILVLVMFWLGWRGYYPMREIPRDAMKVQVTAQMWSWRFQYGNGTVTDTLYVPVNKPVALQLKAIDVIHSLYIPAFRVKEDLVPGKNNSMWFIASTPGRYDLFCSSYCGLRHSYMLSAVVVMPDDKFDSWLAASAQKPDSAISAKPGNAGKLIVDQKGCLACHTIDGNKLVGPSFKGIYGDKVTVLSDGNEHEITVDDGYIKRSIENPDADVVKGYSKGLMVTYKDKLTDDEIKQVAEYLKTLVK